MASATTSRPRPSNLKEGAARMKAAATVPALVGVSRAAMLAAPKARISVRHHHSRASNLHLMACPRSHECRLWHNCRAINLTTIPSGSISSSRTTPKAGLLKFRLPILPRRPTDELKAADLRLERPCMDHMQYLLVRSHNNENQPMHHPMENADDSEHEHMSGHALMATAPPHSHVMQKPAEKYPHQMPLDLGPDGLSKLLDLSNRLPFDRYTEITPVMAWTTILRHERLRELTEADVQTVKEDLSTKVRCYGFGAVLEEFELDDALTNVFAQKDSIPAISYGMGRQQITAA
ncbi:hypothetical protein BTJ68_08102 [Hortaea werneckii EXF-2000]|uniref:Uncharacterized protein n=1 Tax=Hortaea werneckii EXF-2000 TaxID=1157616 RepID=A0A1Z5TCW0_HORWE|nr:hypothetical protein BTJ68_08102 [Hortaea werneckii EXF-2000]